MKDSNTAERSNFCSSTKVFNATQSSHMHSKTCSLDSNCLGSILSQNAWNNLLFRQCSQTKLSIVTQADKISCKYFGKVVATNLY